jgi:hypothetical protein
MESSGITEHDFVDGLFEQHPNLFIDLQYINCYEISYEFEPLITEYSEMSLFAKQTREVALRRPT